MILEIPKWWQGFILKPNDWSFNIIGPTWRRDSFLSYVQKVMAGSKCQSITKWSNKINYLLSSYGKHERYVPHEKNLCLNVLLNIEIEFRASWLHSWQLNMMRCNAAFLLLCKIRHIFTLKSNQSSTIFNTLWKMQQIFLVAIGIIGQVVYVWFSYYLEQTLTTYKKESFDINSTVKFSNGDVRKRRKIAQNLKQVYIGRVAHSIYGGGKQFCTIHCPTLWNAFLTRIKLKAEVAKLWVCEQHMTCVWQLAGGCAANSAWTNYGPTLLEAARPKPMFKRYIGWLHVSDEHNEL